MQIIGGYGHHEFSHSLLVWASLPEEPTMSLKSLCYLLFHMGGSGLCTIYQAVPTLPPNLIGIPLTRKLTELQLSIDYHF